ncbi:hypothetical protein D3C76_1333970 [compost metagenome]
MMNFKLILDHPQHLGLVFMDKKVPAGEHVQGKAATGFLAPADQLLDADPVGLAAEHMHRTFEQRTLDRLETPAQLEVGAQDRQPQVHQLLVGQDFFAGAVERAQMLDQFAIAFRFGKTPVVVDAHRRRSSARGEQCHRLRAAERAKSMGHFTSQQRAEAVAEQGIGRLERGLVFMSQLQRQAAQIGVQRFAVARSAPR